LYYFELKAVKFLRLSLSHFKVFIGHFNLKSLFFLVQQFTQSLQEVIEFLMIVKVVNRSFLLLELNLFLLAIRILYRRFVLSLILVI
jgi:hypothetical protein